MKLFTAHFHKPVLEFQTIKTHSGFASIPERERDRERERERERQREREREREIANEWNTETAPY